MSADDAAFTLAIAKVVLVAASALSAVVGLAFLGVNRIFK